MAAGPLRATTAARPPSRAESVGDHPDLLGVAGGEATRAVHQFDELGALPPRIAAGGLACGAGDVFPCPLLQMLAAALCCLAFRVNLPLALVTTLYTNPLTLVPLYIWVAGAGILSLPALLRFISLAG